MALRADIESSLDGVLKYKWPVTDARVVPEPKDVLLADAAKKLEMAVVLYADLDGSTIMVDTKKWWFSATVYKTYLHTAAKVIKSEGGIITAYDGDRVMAIFVGDDKFDRAARAAMKLNWCVIHIINPKLKARWSDLKDFSVRHNVGIDASDLHAVRTGVRGDNDLVWVGRAANYAAKLTTLSADTPTWITKRVFDALSSKLKVSSNGENMWKNFTWKAMNNHSICASSFWWSVP
jgi:class 3 adenylate cyclase